MANAGRIRAGINASVLALVALALVACGGGSGGAAPVSVPDVVGDTQAAATTGITGAGLVLGTVTTQSSSAVASGSVVSENPAAGTSVASGTAVALVVSSGPAMVAVPNVVGDTQAAATTAITGAGLVLGTVTMQSSSTVASGSVISQNPAAATSVASGSAVALVISSGPAMVAVPNVVGDTQAAATTAITGAGLVLGTVTLQSSSTVPSGNVISQSPTAGTSVTVGSAVNLTVSSGVTNSQVSGDLYGNYLAGIYSVNDANTADSDVLESFTIAGCNQSSSNGATPGTPCPYTSSLTTLASSGASPTSGALSTATGTGLFQSPNTGALTPFQIPTVLTITPPANGDGATWSGAISLNDLGKEMVAMQTAAATGQSLPANILVAVAPLLNTSNATLVGPYQLFGMSTNLTTGLGGDEGILQAIDFDGNGGFTAGSESTNTWDPTTQTGGLQPTTNTLSGTYAVAANGTVTLTFATGATNGGVLNGMTLTGALNGTLLVLTNTSATTGLQARVLLVGISQPANNSQLCTSNPLPGPGSSNGVFQMVGLSFNTALFQQLTFNNSSGPTYTVNYDGGTFNSGGTLSSIPSAGPFNYSINTSCFITVNRQTDGSGNVLDAAWGTVSRDGSVVAFEDFDTMGGGPVLTFGVRISNVQQLN